MTINELVSNYDFHDCKIRQIKVSIDSKALKITLDMSEALRKAMKEKNKYAEQIELVFCRVSNIKCETDVQSINDFVLNIWKTKGTRDGVDVILDREDYLTLFFEAKGVEVFF